MRYIVMTITLYMLVPSLSFCQHSIPGKIVIEDFRHNGMFIINMKDSIFIPYNSSVWNSTQL